MTINLYPQISCPFPSYSKSPDKLSQHVKENPTQAHNDLINESLLINRIGITILGLACSVYLYNECYAYLSLPTLLLTSSVISLPCTLMGLGTFFIGQGIRTFAETEKATQLFQNICTGGAQIGVGLGMTYFCGSVPKGAIEPALKEWAIHSTKTKEMAILKKDLQTIC